MSTPEGAGFVEKLEAADVVSLTHEEEEAVKALVETIDEGEHTERMDELRRCREHREAWNCRLHLAYDSETGEFFDPIQELVEEGDVDEDDLPAHYTDPFYLAYGLDACAILGTVPFKTKFWPGDPDDPKDQTAARRSADLVAWFRKQNDDTSLRFMQAYFEYNDGGFALLTRYRPDAQKYGVRYETLLEQRTLELFPASAQCAFCGMTTRAGEELETPDGACAACGSIETAEGRCAECGEEFDGGCSSCGKALPMDAWKPPVQGEFPVPAGTVEVPNAGIVYEAFGWLECRRPVNAERIEQCPWIQVSLEVDRALAIAAFQDKETEIRSSSYPASGALREERFARESTSSESGTQSEREHQVTYRRVWIRPEKFFDIEKRELRDAIRKKFRTGGLFVFVNDVLVRAKEENLLDYWQIATAYPGLGHAKPAIGTPVLHLQRPHNELFNIRIDGLKAQLPAIVANPAVINVDAMNKTRPKGFAWYAAEPLDSGTPLSQAFAATPTPNLPNDLFRLQDLLPGQRAQHASGIPAVAWGGQMGGAGETFAGYSLMREQGLARMRIPLGPMKLANEGADLQGVKLFRRYHQDDVMLPKDGPAGTTQNDRISLDELDGEIQVRSDQDIAIPATQAERVDRIFRAIKEDGLRDLVVHTGNEGFLKSALGEENIRFPGQDQRDQQRLEIDRLLKGQPVAVEVLLDDHDAHMDALRQWWASTDAESERSRGNPHIQLVLAHYAEHAQAKGQQAFLLAAFAQPPMPPGMPDGGPPGAPPAGPVGPPQGPPQGMAA